MAYTICSLQHFYHLPAEQCWELSYSMIGILMENMVRIQHPETLPKPKKKIKSDAELLEYLVSKYGV